MSLRGSLTALMALKIFRRPTLFFYRSFPEEKQKIASAFINLTNFKARRCQKVHWSNPERDFVQSFFYVSVIFEAK